jgi:hypothetical protein
LDLEVGLTCWLVVAAVAGLSIFTGIVLYTFALDSRVSLLT